MRTAVVRIKVDPSGQLTADQLTAGMAELAGLIGEAQLIENNLAALPPSRREVEILMDGTDAVQLQATAITWCAQAFGSNPEAGVLTFVSHGTDDDAHGVLAGFGLSGQIDRVESPDGWDIIHVTLRKDDLARIPESRIHTALEASTNCEVHIRTV
ncbi:hypothetical protein [Mycobacterium sp. OTB74]|jgi:hypothetical protein|uniref:hypothetical protein n=1 Tax=Mycobacterium sp. OTB74 TaxID=1853452 RepID=UPI00247359D3|nr:hypothetical protein [Mycobacterium sp. OTB74]MDH6245308.1 hypothetical protein [Mycobacterium sp. OTB74]